MHYGDSFKVIRCWSIRVRRDIGGSSDPRPSLYAQTKAQWPNASVFSGDTSGQTLRVLFGGLSMLSQRPGEQPTWTTLMLGISPWDPGTTLPFALPFSPQSPAPESTSLNGPGPVGPTFDNGHAGRPFQTAGRGGWIFPLGEDGLNLNHHCQEQTLLLMLLSDSLSYC